jgi:hypothetical protein
MRIGCIVAAIEKICRPAIEEVEAKRKEYGYNRVRPLQGSARPSRPCRIGIWVIDRQLK